MSDDDSLVSVHTLRRHLDDPAWRIVDCRFDLQHPDRGYREYLSAHIPGAVYAHLDRDLAGATGAETGRHPLPEPLRFAETLGRLGISNERRVVAYDEGGGAIAARLWWLLEWVGHRRVAVLDGGFAAWRAEEQPVATEPSSVDVCEYRVRPAAGAVVTTAEILELQDRGGPLRLFDARAAARYRGEIEPIDPVAGHVPGARNLPFDLSLEADGRFKDRKELRALWQKALGSDPEAPWLAMCGSGVTACHLALSARVAGYGPPRLYAGSWSEWIRDPRRPVATGGDAEQG